MSWDIDLVTHRGSRRPRWHLHSAESRCFANSPRCNWASLPSEVVQPSWRGHVAPGPLLASTRKSLDFRHLRIAASNHIFPRGENTPVWPQASIRPILFGEVTKKGEVYLNARVRQAQKEKRASIDTALIATSRFPEQSSQMVLLHRIGKLECRSSNHSQKAAK